jgi:Mrp family chromosome partitioning ATPase
MTTAPEIEHRVIWDEELLGAQGGKAGLVVASGGPACERSSEMVLARDVITLDPRLVTLADPDSARAASFWLLCDRLIEMGLPRAFAVSSAARHEGKTTCALNLAVTIAQRRAETVLLVDGNFFEPGLAEIFQIDDRTPPAWPVSLPWLAPFTVVELAPQLHVAALLGSGNPPRFELHRFEGQIERLKRAGYDRIIIDAPALDGSPGASLLIAAADAVLFAVRPGRTTSRALRRAVAAIGKDRALGVALMDA